MKVNSLFLSVGSPRDQSRELCLNQLLRAKVRVTVTLHHTDIPPDSAGTILSIDLHPDDVADDAAECAPTLRLLKRFPRSAATRVRDCKARFLKPEPCTRHASTGACEPCTDCGSSLQAVEGAVGTKPHIWQIEVRDANGDTQKMKGFRRQLPLTTILGSTLFAMQGNTADKGMYDLPLGVPKPHQC